MPIFNYETVAEQAGITSEELAELSQRIRQEFPDDDMMYELHMLRICMAIRDKHISIAQAIAREAA